ncbi:carboxymuconolactone decarboxylase family protein [Halocalculus aciditolerans]|uniref:Carboxymuconolactone decarboxylase-like domain-containing protein n=1 Tax=Halocalculus aciditolerans TaxID=1383812 RepID=A0A830FN43_9EURY|nr:carboxymuconolactone decarboxylase family protein [Halocalculus aciditolerans]GGL69269.1 hypothetical protein GCM10009039_29060 [Halocalculus aciditolerans]
MARIPYVDPDDFPAEKRDLLDTLSGEDVPDEDRRHSLEGGTLNVYRAIGQNPPLLDAFRTYAGRVWAESGLTPHEREVVILAASFHADCAYEWHQHVRVALDAGLDVDTVLAISREEHTHLADEHAALAAYVEQFVDGAVTDARYDRLATHYNDPTIVGVTALAGCYLGLARLLQALDVEPEQPFVGWDLEDL